MLIFGSSIRNIQVEHPLKKQDIIKHLIARDKREWPVVTCQVCSQKASAFGSSYCPACGQDFMETDMGIATLTPCKFHIMSVFKLRWLKTQIARTSFICIAQRI